jgi:nitrite reductase/ring-hydroxylating ferredoxin subunit
MTDMRDPRKRVDPAVSGAGREGLTGTAPAGLYDRRDPSNDQISVAPDFQPAAAQPAWRQDFPIDWPQDNYVERRDFMKFMVLTSFAMTVGQFWIAAQNWRRGRRPPPGSRRIASLDALPIGGSIVFGYPGEHDNCVLVRISDTELVAYNQKCTHLSCAVIPRPDRGDIHCPCHEGIFDLKSGRPTAGPPRRPLDRVTLEVHGRDIYATGLEARTT